MAAGKILKLQMTETALLLKAETAQGEEQVFHLHAKTNRVKHGQGAELASWLLKWLSLAASGGLLLSAAGCLASASSACGCRWLCLSLERERSLVEMVAV